VRRPRGPEEYLAENVFWVPEPARWSRLSAISKPPEIGVEIDNAMRAIEEANPTLKDARCPRSSAARASTAASSPA
jgi:type I restriction enzyme M protein